MVSWKMSATHFGRWFYWVTKKDARFIFHGYHSVEGDSFHNRSVDCIVFSCCSVWSVPDELVLVTSSFSSIKDVINASCNSSALISMSMMLNEETIIPKDCFQASNNALCARFREDFYNFWLSMLVSSNWKICFQLFSGCVFARGLGGWSLAAFGYLQDDYHIFFTSFNFLVWVSVSSFFSLRCWTTRMDTNCISTNHWHLSCYLSPFSVCELQVMQQTADPRNLLSGIAFLSIRSASETSIALRLISFENVFRSRSPALCELDIMWNASSSKTCSCLTWESKREENN